MRGTLVHCQLLLNSLIFDWLQRCQQPDKTTLCDETQKKWVAALDVMGAVTICLQGVVFMFVA